MSDPTRAVEVLNEALALDPVAVAEMFHHEVLVNDELADHRSIQVGPSFMDPQPGEYVMRAVGLINGLFGTAVCGWGFIVMEYDEGGNLEQFRVLNHDRCDTIGKHRKEGD